MATYGTVGDAYNKGVRDKKVIGSYRPKETPEMKAARARNQAMVDAGITYKAPTKAVGNGMTTWQQNEINRMNNMNVGGNGVNIGNKPLTVTSPSAKSMSMTVGDNTEGARAGMGSSFGPSYNSEIGQPAPTEEESAATRLQSQVDAMMDAINRRTQSMLAQAAEVNRMNKSRISGTLGRVYGDNYDTSESGMFERENDRYGNETQDIETAARQAAAEFSMRAMNETEGLLRQERQDKRMADKDAFNQMIQEAALTGLLNGAPTMDMRQFNRNALESDRNYGLASDAQSFNQKMGVLDQMLKDRQLTSDEYFKERQLLMDEAALTGSYGGQQTPGEQQRQFENLYNLAILTGMYGDQPTMERYGMNREYDYKGDLLDWEKEKYRDEMGSSSGTPESNIDPVEAAKVLAAMGREDEAIQLLTNPTGGGGGGFTTPPETGAGLMDLLTRWFR